MTKEDKQLLLQDLCARLPYGVIVRYRSQEKKGDVVLSYGNISYVPEVGEGWWWRECKPYLRPMSSMTVEEKKEYNSLLGELNVDNVNIVYIPDINDMVSLINWLNKKMFDFRGLISKGLAISTEEFNPYKDLEYLEL